MQIVLVIDLCPHQILVAHGIDQQRNPVLFHHGVIFGHIFVEREPVLEARAAATLHEHAQLQIRIALFHDQLAHLGGGTVREEKRGGHF